MSVIATALKHLIAAGVSGDDLVRAVAEMEAATDTRSTGAKRQARYRERNKASQTVTRVTSDETPPPNEYISNPPVNPCEASASQSPFAEIVVSRWNDGPAKRGARKAQKLDAARKRDLSARVKEHGQDGVLAAIRGIEASDWHCGIGSNGWKANIGWLLERSKRVSDAMERAAETAGDPHAKQSVDDQAAYLAGLAAKPWANATPRAEQQPRTGNTGPPRAIGECLPLAGRA